MAKSGILNTDEDLLMYTSIFNPPANGEAIKSRGSLIEQKIEDHETLTARVSNRRLRRKLNDQLLMQLVPRLSADEIRGLFAPPPWGEEVPVSAFCMTNVGEWDKFRNIDMDKEASIMKALKGSSKRKEYIDTDKMSVLNAWHRIDLRTREALRRSFLPDLIEGYEKCIRTFIQEGADTDDLILHVQDPFHRLLLHGVCEFYNLLSLTETSLKGSEEMKTTRIRKKKSCLVDLPNITLSHFLRMAKEGV